MVKGRKEKKRTIYPWGRDILSVNGRGALSVFREPEKRTTEPIYNICTSIFKEPNRKNTSPELLMAHVIQKGLTRGGSGGEAEKILVDRWVLKRGPVGIGKKRNSTSERARW